ncbi:MAG: DNA-3-methyladenine glycosylase 2 family protein [Gammaproteobacteria bacterium]|nr:DNA-3-methyladenine glycosylase 2 family protein [Gammaproteobacteria bacterium]
MPVNKLNETTLQHGLAELCRRDAPLRRVVQERGAPPFWVREPGWRTLIKIILEQQVSLSSGRAIYRRLATTVRPLTASRLSSCSIAQLRRAGLTRQKAAYCRGLAAAVADNTLNLASVARQNDEVARNCLCELKGIGPWTADVYLLMALRRPDVWPAGDLALIRAIEDLYDIVEADKQERLVETWRPWRAIAARVLWHDYLARRGRDI